MIASHAAKFDEAGPGHAEGRAAGHSDCEVPSSSSARSQAASALSSAPCRLKMHNPQPKLKVNLNSQHGPLRPAGGPLAASSSKFELNLGPEPQPEPRPALKTRIQVAVGRSAPRSPRVARRRRLRVCQCGEPPGLALAVTTVVAGHTSPNFTGRFCILTKLESGPQALIHIIMALAFWPSQSLRAMKLT
jgi:hypothetical protein